MHRLLCTQDIVFEPHGNQNLLRDTQKIKVKESNHNSKESHHTREESKRREDPRMKNNQEAFDKWQ